MSLALVDGVARGNRQTSLIMILARTITFCCLGAVTLFIFPSDVNAKSTLVLRHYDVDNDAYLEYWDYDGQEVIKVYIEGSLKYMYVFSNPNPVNIHTPLDSFVLMWAKLRVGQVVQ